MQKQTVVYTDSEIEARLSADLPYWTYEKGWIRRKYRTHNWKSTLMLVNTIGHLAELAWHHPDLTVSYAFVIVKLMTHSEGGITEKDFMLASKIEDVIQWQPETEHPEVFEGIPDDARYRYIKHP